MGAQTTVPLTAALILLIIFLVWFAVMVAYFRLWIRARVSGVTISLMRFIGMSLRKVNPNVVLDSYIMARKGGVHVTLDELETHFMARGNVPRVVEALIAANKTHYKLTFEEAAAIDLAGRDPLAEVKQGVVDWEYEFSHMGPNTSTLIEGNCRDGSRAGASVRVRYRRPVSQGPSEAFPLQAETALRLLTYINDAESFSDLERARDRHESELLGFGQTAMKGLQSLELKYFEV